MSVVPYPTVAGAETAHGAQTSAGGNPWMAYFGPAAGPLVTDAYDKYAEQNYDLPEAYKGRNLFLRDTINGLITGAGRNDFYTERLLPWAQTDQITFSWNEFHFNETLAGRVPHEGVSRLVTSSKRTKMDKAVRRGLAMILEHGFMGTAEGQEMYRRNLLGIAQSVQETANHDVMSAIFSCDNYDQRWERDHGIVTDGLRRLMNEEVYRFAAVQKEANGLDILVEDAKKRMGRYGVAPDTMVIPPKLSIYMSLVRPEKSQYYIGGPPAMANVKRGGTMGDFRGLDVFETRSFDVYKGEPPVDISLRRRQVGEYYTVMGNQDIVIYDEAMDNWRKLSSRSIATHSARSWDAGQDDGGVNTDAYGAMLQGWTKEGWTAEGDKTSWANWAEIATSKWKHTDPARNQRPPDPQWAQGGPNTDGSENYWSFVTAAGAVAQDLIGKEFLERVKTRAQQMVTSYDTDAGVPMDISADCRALFDLDSQSDEFKAAFTGNVASTNDRTVVANDVGYTGHPGLHQSYRGLQLIAQHGEAAQIAQARRVLSAVDQMYKMLDCESGINRYAASLVPANYLHTCDGLAPARLSDAHVTKTWLFATVSQCSFGHTLVPVTTDGRIDAAFANLEGGTIVCPGFAVGKYVSARNGAVAGLALTNVGMGVVGNRSPASVSGVEDSRWDLGLPNDSVSYADTHAAAAATIGSGVGGTRPRAAYAGRGEEPEGRPQKRASVAQSARSGGGNALLDMLISSSGARPAEAERVRSAVPAAAAAPHRRSVPRGDVGGHTRHAASARDSSMGISSIERNLADVVSMTNGKEKRDPLYSVAVTSILTRRLGSGSAKVGKEVFQTEFGATGARQPRANDAEDPFAYIIMRPFIEHQMHTILCMKAGAETGSTYYGHNSVTVGDDAVSKMHYVNLTFYSKAVVKESKNIIRLEDVYASGYIGGNNCRWFENTKEVQRYDAAQANAPSLFSSLALAGELRTLANPISLTGVFSAALDRDGVESQRTAYKTHYLGASFMTKLWGFDKITQHDEKTRTVAPQYIMTTRPVNSVCFQGAQFTQQPIGESGVFSGAFDASVPNSGHWGPTYPGVKAVRDGQHKYLRPNQSATSPSMPVSAMLQ